MRSPVPVLPRGPGSRKNKKEVWRRRPMEYTTPIAPNPARYSRKISRRPENNMTDKLTQELLLSMPVEERRKVLAENLTDPAVIEYYAKIVPDENQTVQVLNVIRSACQVLVSRGYYETPADCIEHLTGDETLIKHIGSSLAARAANITCRYCGSSERMLVRHPHNGAYSCLPCMKENSPDWYAGIEQYVIEKNKEDLHVKKT